MEKWNSSVLLFFCNNYIFCRNDRSLKATFLILNNTPFFCNNFIFITLYKKRKTPFNNKFYYININLLSLNLFLRINPQQYQ